MLVSHKISEKQKTTGYTVIAIIEAKPGNEEVLKKALMDIAELSRHEATCREYRLHQDVDNLAQFVLYENWESKEAHQLQFKKPYIIDLVQQLPDLLAKPYQAVFAQQI